MELKTLRDIQSQKGFHNLKQYSKAIPNHQMYNKVIEGGEELAVFPSDLRQEAIKWIKDFESRMEIKGILNIATAEISWENQERDVRSNISKRDVLRDFFNITEEDLK